MGPWLMRSPLLKTLLVVVALLSAFKLGRYSLEFSGTPWSWSALAAYVVALAGSLGALFHDFWSV